MNLPDIPVHQWFAKVKRKNLDTGAEVETDVGAWWTLDEAMKKEPNAISYWPVVVALNENVVRAWENHKASKQKKKK